MSQSLSNSTNLKSISGLYGEIQIVGSPDRVLLDIDARHYDTTAHLHHQHALLNLRIGDARYLREALDAAIEAAESAEPRQPGLWSDETVRQAARRVGRGFVWPAPNYGPKSGGGRKP